MFNKFRQATAKKTAPIAVEVINVSKSYAIHHEKPTLVEKLIQNKNEEFVALSNISFTIRIGEQVGIVGVNGSGKTTLLKLITKIAHPTSGKINTYGKIVSLIDLNAGFHPDLTGYQNIFLSGMVLGMRKSEINDNLSKIIRFAGIGKFIDIPIYTYSEGMKLRLGFAIAAYSNPDIIVLDEGLSVGDWKFQQKIVKFLHRYKKLKKTLIVCTHVTGMIRENCSRVIILHKGKIKVDGTIDKLALYDHK